MEYKTIKLIMKLITIKVIDIVFYYEINHNKTN